MIKKLLALLLVLNAVLSYAETIKTDVLVIGGGASGVAAAIQSARSKVPTLLIEQGPWLGGSMTAGGMCILEANRKNPAGIFAEYRNHIRKWYKPRLGYDTTSNAPLVFEPSMGASTLKKMVDTVKNLAVKLNTGFTAIKKDGNGWEVSITQNGQTDIIKAKVVVDATEFGDVAAKAGAIFTSGFDSRKDTGEQLAPDNATNQIQDISYLAILKDYGRAADKTIAKPAGYDASRYTCLKTQDIKKLLAAARLPNEKYLINWANCGNQYSVTAEDLQPENRADTYNKARLRTLGLIYFLQTTLGYKNLGMAEDYPTPDKLPFIPYVRENGRAAGLIRMVIDDIYSPYNRASQLYRTSIAVGDAMPGQFYSEERVPHINYPPFPAYGIPLGSIVAKDMENLLVTEKSLSVTHLVNGSITYPSIQMTLGQGVGAAAAYCAFFKTSTKNLNVRVIQQEILDYKGIIMPFNDIATTDPDYRAIQQVGASGILQAIQKANGNSADVLFMPDSSVKTADIQPMMIEMYARAFLWFNKEKPGEVFTLGNLLSYISEMNLADPQTLQKTMAASWKTKYKFTLPFDVKRPVTRREFAVLANRYFNPFARRVDITGKLIN
ncbi:FAD-dependent oxidoreductase [Mucilaginibacter pallidiroseus]|uniref:FAD-dependent oxidoreductase n=1 Tax=Mucilaginibacter pallidiroseus TaxID=2599295 RepID=A0A563UEK2_9SPHI|nr:FAD-dependent oxidoreductase [Mucilaginibacter pallidiroseus]TWR29713.1 FAD-dependent oxidoreductase [Mucilaginibacter pallidiroseus]